ncbi:TlpA family protein disulfide reductase [Salirhabdus salicampi]|nr:TlpA family protein disulfide reductase [Salirhabdus salicampi]
MKDKNFVIVAVAFDTAGISAVKEWIDKANPTYPCLIDKNHIVAELYNMVNVPNAVWINEQGNIVRGAEPAGWNDGWRTENLSRLEQSKSNYFNALRNWVHYGDKSKHVLPTKEVKNRMSKHTYEKALAAAYFKLGIYLTEHKQLDKAKIYFNKTVQLHPESWNYKRQSWSLVEPKEEQRNKFREALKELEDKPYYPILQLHD